MKQADDGPGPKHLDPLLDERVRLRPVAFEGMQDASNVVGDADCECVMGRLGDPDRIALAFGGLAESAELSELAASQQRS